MIKSSSHVIVSCRQRFQKNYNNHNISSSIVASSFHPHHRYNRCFLSQSYQKYYRGSSDTKRSIKALFRTNNPANISDVSSFHRSNRLRFAFLTPNNVKVFRTMNSNENGTDVNSFWLFMMLSLPCMFFAGMEQTFSSCEETETGENNKDGPHDHFNANKTNNDDDNDAGVQEDWSDLDGEADKETDCTLCLGFREGPCGNYWRRQERCMDKFKSDEDDQLDSGDDNSSSNSNNSEIRMPAWAEPCEKQFVAWNKCLQNYSDWYERYFKEAADQEVEQYDFDIDREDNDRFSHEKNIESVEEDVDSQQSWNRRLTNLEKVIEENFGPAIDFPEASLPQTVLNIKNGTGIVIFPMDISLKDVDTSSSNSENIIIGYVRDDKGQLLGVARREELETIQIKGALEFGSINGFTDHIYIIAAYEGEGTPLMRYKMKIKNEEPLYKV
mmetsp:Transcript_5383/g.7260  ORF Transcript_5383/g.7260 Transcript_5383/m.7260 type:complete len:442 (-) Transcript_5383:56-1381(-)